VLRKLLLMTMLAALALPASAYATFPGQNGKIAFERGGDIWTMNADGSGQSNLTGVPTVPPPFDEDPAWSPDGSRLAFISPNLPTTSAPQLWTMNADGSGKTHLGNDVTPDREPAWSPDGTEIAFLIAGNYFKTPPDGSNYMQLPGEPGGGLSLDWSPDGQFIAYAHTCEPSSGSGYIGIMAATPPYGRTAVTSSTTCEGENRVFPNWDRNPSWSPDGQRILFGRSPGDGSDTTSALYTIRPDGTDLQLVKSYAGLVQGRWSPDGTKIVAAFDPAFPPPPGGCTPVCIHVMNADGSGETPITPGADPDWQPIPINAYPRPKGASPLQVSLVPAYEPCTASNSTHGAPLAFPSCTPPDRASAHLTTGTPDANGRPVRMNAALTLKVTTGDVLISTRLNDVANTDLTDYTGSLRAQLPVRITDKFNTPHPGGPGAATTQPFVYGFTVPCATNPEPTTGSDCELATSMNALAPGTHADGRRAVWLLGQVRVFDGGADSDGSTTADNTVFAVEGVFIP